MRRKKQAAPDELLNEALEIIQIRLHRLRQQAESDSMEPEEDRILASYAKTLTDLQREIRQSMKDIDAKQLSDKDLKEELEKLISNE